jgi:PAS domain S-box-containing protein
MIRLNNENGVLYTLRNISEVKQAHEAVRQSEGLYKTLINSMPNLVLIMIDGNVAFASDVMMEITGCAKEEMLGKDIRMLFGDAMTNQMMDGLDKLINGTCDPLEDSEFRLVDKKGRQRFLSVRVSFILYNGRDARICVMNDITERKTHESYVRGKIIETEENERRRFAADIHDDLGPMISTLKLHLGLIENARDIGHLKDIIGTCYNLLNEMIAKVRAISNNIMPNLIEKYGVEAAVKSLCDRISDHDLTFEFSSNLGESRFPRETELHLYRIISELINNSLKHSGGTHVAIDLRATPEKLRILYADNGKGYDPEEAQRNSAGIGLSNILNRVNLIGGNIEFTRENDQVQVNIVKEL